MTGSRTYASASAFRTALEERLKQIAHEESIDLQRVRRQVSFDRLLCRLFSQQDAPWLLKGGYAMELRINAARTTRDIDLAIKQLPIPKADWDSNLSSILELLRDAGHMDLQDFFVFNFGVTMKDLDATPYGGARFPIDARLAGRTFAKFHLDVSAGDVLSEPYESLSGKDWLEFAGIKGLNFSSISPEEQFAEKLHAYTLPRPGRENSRVKDLVDLRLLIDHTKMDVSRLQIAIQETFRRRKTHEIPHELQAPPNAWRQPFAALAKECGLSVDLEAQFRMLDQFFKKLIL